MSNSTCEYCGEPFARPGNQRNRRYCCREHKELAKEQRKAAAGDDWCSDWQTRTCAECGVRYEWRPAGSGAPPKYCSVSCRRQVQRRREADAIRDRAFKPCRHCGAPRRRGDGSSMFYCSDCTARRADGFCLRCRCCGQEGNVAAVGKPTLCRHCDHKRRSPRYSRFRGSNHSVWVYMKDGRPAGRGWLIYRQWILERDVHCWRCLDPIDRSLKFPDPMSATVGHVIALADGGSWGHPDNCHAEHFVCNNRAGVEDLKLRSGMRKGALMLRDAGL